MFPAGNVRVFFLLAKLLWMNALSNADFCRQSQILLLTTPLVKIQQIALWSGLIWYKMHTRLSWLTVGEKLK